MKGKFAILLVLAAAAQISLAQNTSESCLESTAATTSIKSDLAIIDYGRQTSLNGLRNMEDAIYNEITSILADKSSRRRLRSRNANARFELAKKKAFDNLMVGIEPTLLAIKVFQPDTDVPSLVANSTTVCEEFIDLIFSAINLTRVATNYTASQAELATYAEALVPLGVRLIQGLYGSLISGSTPIPDSSVPVISCVGPKARAHILSAMASVSDQVAVLLAAIFNIGTQDALARITAIHRQARLDFDTEVRFKYSMIQNLRVAEYIKNSADTVTALYDMLSIVPEYTSL